MRFLIIDDNSADRELITICLRREFPGAVFREVGRETELEAAIAEGHYDVILTDYQLMWSNGIEILKHLQTLYPDIPIIMFTGTGNEEVAVEGLRAGLSNYILKKHLDRLPYAIRESLEKVQLRRQYEDAIEQLRRSEERYRELFDQGLTGVFVFAAPSSILTCNTAFARLFGFPSIEDALQTDLPSLYPHQEDYAHFIDLLLREKHLEYYEMEMRRSNGEPIYVVANIVGTFDEQGQLIEGKGYLFDNTEQHRLAGQLQQAQKLESIALLVSGIAHDFNNMLGGIIGYTNRSLSQLPAPHPVYDNLTHIQEIATRAANMTRQLTAFSRRQVLTPTHVNLNDIVENLLEFLGKLLGENIEIEFQREKDLKTVLVDATQMEQVLMNLCINARDAMNGSGKLTICTRNLPPHKTTHLHHEQTPSTSYVQLSVQDSGFGMTPDVIEHIFEPFFTTKALGQGTGLGLSMVHGIIAQHNGSVEVTSKPGEGTTFYLYLPIIEERAENGVENAPVCLQISTEKVKRAMQSSGESLLIVEDDPDLRFLMQEILRDAGYHVITASNGVEGLATFEQQHGEFALIVADLMTPKMTGKELYDRVRSFDSTVRFLFVSGYPSHQINQKLMLDGDFSLLPKPFDLDDLVTKVQEVLEC